MILEEKYCKAKLSPISLTRHVSDIRVGIFTVREKWQKFLGDDHANIRVAVPANIIPSKNNFAEILEFFKIHGLTEEHPFPVIHFPWHIYQMNDRAIREDFELLTENSASAAIPATVNTISPENIFIEEGVTATFCTINASTGPVYLGKSVTISEGACIRGPFATLEGSVIKMGACIYGATTLGPQCTVGGEIKNVVMQGYSNKGHDGYLGDSVIGEWCNFGAGSSNSNLKNTASEVKYSFPGAYKNETAGNKGGLVMGDYSRCAINTSFNTGTVVGVCCNIFEPVWNRRYVDNFTWGNEKYILEKAGRDVENWKRLKGKALSEEELSILKMLYEQNA